MFYMTCCIGDDLILSEDCIKDLFNQYYERYSELFDVNTYIRHLVSKEDCLEYQDFTTSRSLRKESNDFSRWRNCA